MCNLLIRPMKGRKQPKVMSVLFIQLSVTFSQKIHIAALIPGFATFCKRSMTPLDRKLTQLPNRPMKVPKMNELEKLLNPDNRILAQLLQEAKIQPFKVLEISYSPGNIPARKG